MMSGGTFLVQETPEEIGALIGRALQEGGGWFTATAAPETEPILVNAQLILCVGRERTPVERAERVA